MSWYKARERWEKAIHDAYVKRERAFAEAQQKHDETVNPLIAEARKVLKEAIVAAEERQREEIDAAYKAYLREGASIIEEEA